MFETFKELCDYYTRFDCKDCPYDNCESMSECRKSYDLDKNTMVSRLDLIIETTELRNKLDKILYILENK